MPSSGKEERNHGVDVMLSGTFNPAGEHSDPGKVLQYREAIVQRTSLAPFLRKTELVRTWLLAIGLLLLTSGCIIFPEVEGKPEEINLPPEILIESLVPPDDGKVVDLSLESTPALFKVGQVLERNTEDTLYVGWFLDWDRTKGKSPNGNWSLIFANREIVRPGPELEIEGIVLENYQDGSDHTLRVVIADRAAEVADPYVEGEPWLKFPDDDDGYYDMYSWTFRVLQ
jgi:hypothetical protein